MLLSDLYEDVQTTVPPPDVVQAFAALGDQQRGEPERAMLRVQHVSGGGVLNPTVEHVGDITHRMSHMVEHGMVLGYEKVVKTLRWLSHGYGFEREFRENTVNNAQARNMSPKLLAQQISAALREYAEAHAKLPVYNRAQWLAREAAIALGLEQFDKARACLQSLLDIAPTEAEFAAQAMQYNRNPDGSLRHYQP